MFVNNAWGVPEIVWSEVQGTTVKSRLFPLKKDVMSEEGGRSVPVPGRSPAGFFRLEKSEYSDHACCHPV